MIKLRVVGTSADQTELILSNQKKGRRGTHAVPIDKRLLMVLQDAVYARRDARDQAVEAAPPPVEPKLAPRDIQKLLRAGTSPKQVAGAAGVDIAYVEQFYPPVLYERAGVISDAQQMYVEKPRLGASGLPLGEAVAINLARRVKVTDEMLAGAWSATRKEGQPWIVTLTFPFRGRARRAAWKVDQRARSLSPVNKLAVDLGWTAATGRRAARVISLSPTPEAAPAKKRAAAKKPASTKKPAAKKPAGTKKRAPARKPVARKPAPAKKRAPARRPVARTPAARRPVARKPAARKPVARKPARARRR